MTARSLYLVLDLIDDLAHAKSPDSCDGCRYIKHRVSPGYGTGLEALLRVLLQRGTRRPWCAMPGRHPPTRWTFRPEDRAAIA